MVTKKMDVPDIGNLLGVITQKRDSGELPKTDIQYVETVKTKKHNNVNEFDSKDVKTQKSTNVKTLKQDKPGIGGRPMKLKRDVTYLKISPRIPESLKEEMDVAVARKRFVDEDDKPITTIDGIVELALIRLLYKK